MHGVLQLTGCSLKYGRPLKGPLILHHQKPYGPDTFSNFLQVLIRVAGYENSSNNYMNRETENQE